MNKITTYKFTSADEIQEVIAKDIKHFVNCDFSKLDLIQVSLQHCLFEQDCQFVKTKFGDISHSKFYSANFTQADFSQADISNCYAINCNATRVNMRGVKMTLDCFFFGGLHSESELDGWKLCWWSTLFNTKTQSKIREFVPEKYHNLMNKFFNVGARLDD